MTPTKIITFIQPRPLDGKREDTGDDVDQHRVGLIIETGVCFRRTGSKTLRYTLNTKPANSGLRQP